MIVQSIEEKDIPFILELENDRIKNSLGIEELKASLINDGYLCLTLKNEETLLGYIMVSLTNDESEIYSIAIAKNSEGKGLGTLLLNSLDEELKRRNIKRILLEVNSENIRAIKLYEKNGFMTYRIRKNYYSDNNDAICMKKEI